MRDETKKDDEVLEVIVEPGCLIASGVSIKIAEHDGKKCVGCSQFMLTFVTDDKSSFQFAMHGREFQAYYESLGKALEKLAEAVEEEPHA